jgi:hypothetical protein
VRVLPEVTTTILAPHRRGQLLVRAVVGFLVERLSTSEGGRN